MSIETSNIDNLVSGSFPQVTKPRIAVTGQGLLARGTVMGTITASGKLAKVDKSKSDGSQTATSILATAVDTTSADAACVVYRTGQFRGSELIFGGASVLADHQSQLETLSIFID